MSLESGPKRPERPKDAVAELDSVEPRVTPNGDIWYFDKDGKVVVLDEEGEEEFNRQQLEPDSDPAPGYPKFRRSMAMEDIPSASPADTDAGQAKPETMSAGPDVAPAEAEPTHAITPEREREAEELLSRLARRSHIPGAGRGPVGRDIPTDDLERELNETVAGINRDTRRREAIDPARVRPGEERLGSRLDSGTRAPSPEDPAWVGQYFANTDGTQSWLNFDPGRTHADIVPKTLEEIRANPKHLSLFGEMLKAIHPTEEIFDRMVRNEPLNDAQEQFLRFAQYEFTRQLQRAEKLQRELTPQKIERIMTMHPGFQTLIERWGLKAASELYREQTLHVAMRDKGTFDRLAKDFRTLTDKEQTKRAQKAEKEVQEICDRLGIPRRNYGLVFEQGTEEEIRERVTARIHERAGAFRRGIDWIERATKIPIIGSSRTAALMTMREADKASPTVSSLTDPRSWVTSKINESRLDIANVLADISDEEIRKRMDRSALLGISSAPRAGVDSLDQARAVEQELSRDEIQRLFDRYKLDHRTNDGRGWGEMDENERKQFRARWNPREMQQYVHQGGHGFWALIRRALARLTFETRRKELSIA